MVSFILGGAAPTPIPRGVTLPHNHQPYSKPSQLHLFTNVHLQSPKFRAFSVRSCGRTENYKVRSSGVMKSAIDVGFDYSGRRVTIGDVGNKDPPKSFQTDINGILQVLGDNVVYVPPKNYPLKLTLKFLKIKAESLLEKGKVAAFFLLKASFSASLFASSVPGLPVAVFALFIHKIFRLPVGHHTAYFYVTGIEYMCNGRLVDMILSDVLRDPNQRIEEKRWKMIGQYIALNGGVVTAEEVAPYLDPQTTENMDDESYMLPVLQLFNGQPKVDQEGNILYHFPSVHCTPLQRSECGKEYAGRWVYRDIQVDKFLKERKWKFRAWTQEDIASATFFIFYNLVCSMLWGSSTMNDSRSYMSYIFLSLLKMYVIYIVSFMAFAHKTVSFIDEKINAEITKRNEARECRAKALELPNLSLKRKLSSARDMARRASIGNDRFVYKIENDLYEQQDYERQEWDRRLEMKIQNE